MILIASVVLVLRVAVAVTGLYTHAPTGCDIVILGKPDDEHWSSTHAFQDAIEATVQTRDRDWKEFRLVFESEDEQPTGYLQMRKRGNATDITLRNWASSESSSQREELQTPAQAENLFVRWTTIALRRSNNTLHVTVGKTIEKTFTVNTEPFKFVYAYVPAHQYIRVGFGCKRGCQIHTLNGTSSGESWTPSVEIKSRVTLALKSPAGDPWQEIDVEFESQTGANVGTLQLLREGGSSVTFTLSSWPTTVHSDRQKTVSHKSQGALNNLLQLQDWVYVNVSAGESVRVALKDSSVVFKKLNARAFKKLYVRVPDGQDLQVAFNCGKAAPALPKDSRMSVMVPLEPRTDDGRTSPIIIVGVLLLVGVIAVGNVQWLRNKRRSNKDDASAAARLN
ncbi:uncharacterized protein [Macrobrachium rosenbergii]|uniref:uncharacterized protein isoform X3 n=1 Tax=Macrobrachium rosenbergii TaxID=79674 RepID=UPI0034D537DD